MKRHYLNALLALTLLQACGGGGTEPTSNLLGGGFAPGEVRALQFDGNNNAEISFGDLSGGEQFTFVFFAANVNEGAFNLQLSSLNNAAAAKFLENIPEENSGGEEDPTATLHHWLREQEQDLVGLEPYHADSDEKALVSQSGSCGQGRGTPFKVLSSFSSNSAFTWVCGILAHDRNHASYFIDERDLGVLSAGDLVPIVDDFEAKIDLERSLLGQESDVDQNGKILVLYSHQVNSLGLDQGGVVTAFFFGGDLFPASSFPSSNQAEILFAGVPDPAGNFGIAVDKSFWASNFAITVLTHEFQHMISFNLHVIQKGHGAEHTWANEGISHLLEDLNPTQVLSHVSVENPSRVANYLNSPEQAPFTAGASIAQRGGSYLFFRYLYEQAEGGRIPGAKNGQELLWNLLHSDFRGVENIEDSTGMSFKDLLFNFYVSLEVSQSGISSDPQFNFQGINLRSAQNDNRNTVLDGVFAFSLNQTPVDASIQSPGGIYYEANGDSIMGLGSVLHFTGSQGMNPGGAIIRVY